MNNKVIGTLVVIAGLAGAAGWWATHPSTPVPQKVADAPAPKAAVPKVPATPRPAVPADQAKPRVELPTAPPAPAQPASETVKTEAPANNPQAELKAAVDDIAKRIRAGDILALMEQYMRPEQLAKMPPDARAQMEREMQRPEAKQMFEMMAQIFDSLKDQQPEMNAAGDEATYMLTPPPGMAPPDAKPEPMRFKKINGRWYVLDGPD